MSNKDITVSLREMERSALFASEDQDLTDAWRQMIKYGPGSCFDMQVLLIWKGGEIKDVTERGNRF